jgi:hypothetical protein
MVKHIIFSVLLNVLIIASLIVGIYGFKMDNYFIPILCAASFGLSLHYKLKHIKIVRAEMQLKAEKNIKLKSTKKVNTK